MLVVVLLLSFSEKGVQYCFNIDSTGRIVLPFVIHITEVFLGFSAHLCDVLGNVSVAVVMPHSSDVVLSILGFIPIVDKSCLFPTFLDECLQKTFLSFSATVLIIKSMGF